MRRRREGFLVWPERRAPDKTEAASAAPESTKAWKMEQKSDMAMLAPLARLYPNKPLSLHSAANPLPPSYLHPALLIAHSFPPLSLNSFRAEYDKSRIRKPTISRLDFFEEVAYGIEGESNPPFLKSVRQVQKDFTAQFRRDRDRIAFCGSSCRLLALLPGYCW